MLKNFKSIATSLTSLIFIVVSITGVLMFLHIFDNYTKDLHEVLGIAFVIITLFHLFFNWKSMKNHFDKKIFKYLSIAVFSISVVFVASSDSSNNGKGFIIDKVVTAPINYSLIVLEKNQDIVLKKLQSMDIEVQQGDSIVDIANNNNLETRQVLRIILNN